MNADGDGDGGDFVVAETAPTPRLWWSAFDRAAGPLLGALVTLNVMDFCYEVDTSPWWASADAALAVVVLAVLAVWFLRGRDQDRVAIRSWELTRRTYGAADRGATVTITPVAEPRVVHVIVEVK